MDIRTDLTAFLVDVLGVTAGERPLPEEAHLVDDLGLDSAGIFELILWIEDRVGCRIPPRDMVLENFKNIAAVEAYIQTAGQAAADMLLQDAAE